MTAKQFFKSTAFRCLAVLLCILLISGILLTFANGLFGVSDEEKFSRKISVIYSGETVSAKEEAIGDRTTNIGNATVERIWYVAEKSDYLVQASSRGNGGNVTSWISLKVTGEHGTVTGVNKVIIYAVADSAEFSYKIGQDVFDSFRDDYYTGKEYNYGNIDHADYIYTGASVTLSAVCRSVNAAIKFVNGVDDPFKEFVYRDFIDTDHTSIAVDGTTVNYVVKTYGNGNAHPFTISISVGEDKKISAYHVDVNGTSDGWGDKQTDIELTGKSLADIEGYLNDTGVVETGATLSNILYFNAAAFALANYERALTFEGGNA